MTLTVAPWNFRIGLDNYLIVMHLMISAEQLNSYINCANLTSRRLSKVSVIKDKQLGQKPRVQPGPIEVVAEIVKVTPTPLSRRANLIRNLKILCMLAN